MFLLWLGRSKNGLQCLCVDKNKVSGVATLSNTLATLSNTPEIPDLPVLDVPVHHNFFYGLVAWQGQNKNHHKRSWSVFKKVVVVATLSTISRTKARRVLIFSNQLGMMVKIIKILWIICESPFSCIYSSCDPFEHPPEKYIFPFSHRSTFSNRLFDGFKSFLPGPGSVKPQIIEIRSD